LNLRPPGPELWNYKLQVLYLVSLREQRTSFSLAQLYRSCTERRESAVFGQNFAVVMGNLEGRWRRAMIVMVIRKMIVMVIRK
jgi:hypothetical protein